jgi:hypothetical protein
MNVITPVRDFLGLSAIPQTAVSEWHYVPGRRLAGGFSLTSNPEVGLGCNLNED